MSVLAYTKQATGETRVSTRAMSVWRRRRFSKSEMISAEGLVDVLLQLVALFPPLAEELGALGGRHVCGRSGPPRRHWLR